MTLDNLLNPEDCDHPVIRSDKPQPDILDDGRLVYIAQWTCYHPREPHCGTSMSGRKHELGREFIGYDKQFYPTQKRGLYRRKEE